jgi:membrane fusion protein (multidrug efflux system)
LRKAQARAVVGADQAALTFSQREYDRVAGLERTGATPVRETQQWQAAVREKSAALARDTLAISVAEKQVDVLNANLANASAMLAQRQSALQQAELDLGYTTIAAPVDGTVGDRTLRIGQYVQAGTQLMAVVPR